MKTLKTIERFGRRIFHYSLSCLICAVICCGLLKSSYWLSSCWTNTWWLESPLRYSLIWVLSIQPTLTLFTYTRISDQYLDASAQDYWRNAKENLTSAIRGLWKNRFIILVIFLCSWIAGALAMELFNLLAQFFNPESIYYWLFGFFANIVCVPLVQIKVTTSLARRFFK